MTYLVHFSFKVTLTQTYSFNVILSLDTTKRCFEIITGEMAKMDSELKQCTLTAFVRENKDEGQSNYIIKVILPNRICSRNQHILRATER